MYNQTYWLDHVTEYTDRFKEVNNGDGSITHTPVTGEIIQQGTPQNQTNFNNIEMELQDQHIFDRFMVTRLQYRNEEVNARLDGLGTVNADILAEITPEYHTITLTNESTYPFNDSIDVPATVDLDTARVNTSYHVQAIVTGATGGSAGDVHITERALNGFKVYVDGGATEATVTLVVWGGTIADPSQINAVLYAAAYSGRASVGANTNYGDYDITNGVLSADEAETGDIQFGV